jgi:hypothetical protein
VHEFDDRGLLVRAEACQQDMAGAVRGKRQLGIAVELVARRRRDALSADDPRLGLGADR